MSTPVSFGELLRLRRKKMEMTLIAICRKIGGGFNKGYLSGIENGKVNPPSESVTKKLARALELDEGFLLALGHATKAPRQIREQLVKCVWFTGGFSIPPGVA